MQRFGHQRADGWKKSQSTESRPNIWTELVTQVNWLSAEVQESGWRTLGRPELVVPCTPSNLSSVLAPEVSPQEGVI